MMLPHPALLLTMMSRLRRTLKHTSKQAGMARLLARQQQQQQQQRLLQRKRCQAGRGDGRLRQQCRRARLPLSSSSSRRLPQRQVVNGVRNRRRQHQSQQQKSQQLLLTVLRVKQQQPWPQTMEVCQSQTASAKMLTHLSGTRRSSGRQALPRQQQR
jgi:hypothetical protein